MDFLAFLVQTLWQNKQKIIRGIPLIPQGIRTRLARGSFFWQKCRQWETHAFSEVFGILRTTGFLGHNFCCRHARRSIKSSKDADDHLVSKKILSYKSARWISAQGQLKWVKDSKTCLLCDVTKRKTPSQIKQRFFNRTRRLAESVDGLNSSVAIVDGEI